MKITSTISEQVDNKPHCFHCLEEIDRYTNISVEVKGIKQYVCCYGCKAASEFLNTNNLTEFYHRRDLQGNEVLKSQQRRPKKTITDWSFLDEKPYNSKYISQSEDGKRFINLYIEGIYCASCSWLINKALTQFSTSIHINFDINAKKLFIEVSDSNLSIEDIVLIIEHVGYKVIVLQINALSIEFDQQLRQENHLALKRIAVAGLGMMQVMMFAVGIYFGDSQGMLYSEYRFLALISMLVATVVVFYSGKPFFLNAWNDIKNYHLGMDVPIALAIGGAYFPSVYQLLIRSEQNIHGDIYFDSAVMFIFFLSVGRYIEMRARHKVSSTPAALNRMLPESISVQRSCSTGISSIRIEPSEVMVGDIIRLSQDQLLPFDGVVIEGEALIDEALITGESQSVQRKQGDHVLAGTAIVKGCIEIKSTTLWSDSTIAKIETTLAKAHLNSSNEVDVLQTIAQVFVMAMLCITLVVAITWYFLEPTRVFEIVLAMLVASCPCAFSLAAPTASAAASYILKANGLLLVNFNALKVLPLVSAWCFDKTGTITEGRPTISNIITYTEATSEYCLKIAAAIESESKHVLSAAFSEIVYSDKIENSIEYPSEGVTGTVNSSQYFLGKPDWVIEKTVGCCSNKVISDLNKFDTDSIISLASKDEYLASFYIRDELRSHVDRTISLINGNNHKVFILSGDRQSAVKALAGHLLVDELKGDCLPADKMQFVKELQVKGEVVAMLGDGVNDAPVLAQADVSIVMSNANELSTSQADVVLLNGDLTKLDLLQKVAIKTQKVTRQNLLWALLYNLIVLPTAAFGLLTPWLAALGMSLSSLFVVLNATRIGKNKYD